MIATLYMLFNFQRSTKAIFLPPKYMQTLLECKKFFRQPWKKYFEKYPPPPTFNVGKVVEVGTWGKNACLSQHCARGKGHFWIFLNLWEILKYFFHHCKTRFERSSKLTFKTTEWCQWCRSAVFIVDFEHIAHLGLVFLLLILNM